MGGKQSKPKGGKISPSFFFHFRTDLREVAGKIDHAINTYGKIFSVIL